MDPVSLYTYCTEQDSPQILQEWHPAKNESLTPETIAAKSNRSVWWQCRHGHEWRAKPEDRILRNHGCPYCAGRRVLAGFNDLKSQVPQVALEWHPSLNGELTPESVTTGSKKKVWWRCAQGHEWQAPVKARALSGTTCPVCSHRQVLPGENDLATTHPDIADEWHPTKNGTLTPQSVFSGSIRKVWWQCKEGHEWQASIASRRRCACPYCTGRAILPGYNDLASQYPEIANQWHAEMNGSVTPDSISPFSNRKVWWICEKGHTWDAAVALRTAKKQGCPYCANRRVLPGFNDLRTKAPRVAAQWHPTLNGDLTPDMVTSGSKKKVWWICQDGHVWKSVIFSRATTQQHGCPICSGRYKLKTPE